VIAVVQLTTGDHDDRVVPLHSYKLIAELQHTLGQSDTLQRNPLIIRIDVSPPPMAHAMCSGPISAIQTLYLYVTFDIEI